MITFMQHSLARNTRDVTTKHVHSEKQSDVNRRIVAVFKITVFGISIGDCFQLDAVF